jgi:hypothetical protein
VVVETVPLMIDAGDPQGALRRIGSVSYTICYLLNVKFLIAEKL